MRAASRSAEPTSSSARRWALSSVPSASDALVERISSDSRRALLSSSATSFSARDRTWPAESFARAMMSAAWALACDRMSADCSSAERRSCSMRDPSPAYDGRSASRSWRWASLSSLVSCMARASAASTRARASSTAFSSLASWASTWTRSYPRIVMGKSVRSSDTSMTSGAESSRLPPPGGVPPGEGGRGGRATAPPCSDQDTGITLS